MEIDTQVRMFYPSPRRDSRRVRGPVQTVTRDDGRETKNQLYIFTRKAMAFATKANLHLGPMPVTE